MLAQYVGLLHDKNLAEAEAILLESKLTNAQKKRVLTMAGLTTAQTADTAAIDDNTGSKTVNAIVTEAIELSEEDELAQKWLSIGAEEVDTLVIDKNTKSKTANLKVTNKLKKASDNLFATLKANPYKSFIAIAVALGIAMGKIADRVYSAEKYAKKALDKSAEKVDDVRSEVESLNSELKTTQDRIDELNAKEHLTLVEQEELNRLKETNEELEREIRLKRSLLSKEEKQANNKAKKYFNTKKEGTDYIFYDYGEDIEKVDYINAVEKRIDKLQAYSEGKIKLSEETISSYKDYVESALSDFMKEDDYLIDGLDDGILDRLDALYEKYDIYTNGRGAVVEKKISGILAKVDFQNDAKQLEKLGKEGSLSIDILNSRFPKLISYLEDAGVLTEDLYQYIMALSNPDAINYDEVKKQLLEKLHIRDGIVGGASDQRIYDLAESKGLLDKKSLEAFLVVKTKFTDEETERWSVDDWAYYIQQEMNKTLSKVSVITKSEMIDTINGLSDGFDVLDDIYADVKDGDVFDFTKLDTKKFEEAFKELKPEYEEFIETVSSSPNDMSKCQDAFNKLATAYINQKNILENVNEENANVAIAMLRNMGIANAEAVITEQLAIQKEKAKYATEEFTEKTYDDVYAMFSEVDAASIAGKALAQLALEKIAVNNEDINTSSDIDQIISLANAAGAGVEALSQLAKAKHILYEVENETRVGQQMINNGQYEWAQNIIDQINNGTYEYQFHLNPDEFKYAGADKSNKSGGSEKDTTETFDWIERAIESLESKMSRLQKVIDSTYSSFAEKNQAIADQIELVNKEIQLQQQAYNGYMQKAESVGLSDQYKELVKNGSINIEDITDEDLQKAINDYKSWYDKAQETQDKINDLYEESNDLHVKAYENGASELEQLRDSQAISEREYLDRMTTLWKFYYENQVALAEVAKEKKLALLNDEKSYLQSVGNAALKLLDNQIDDLEDQKDIAVQGYKDQIEVLENLKKPLQDQLDMMDKARDKEDKILALQKAQYALKRAENQRDKLMYKDGQMVYTADDKVVKEKKDDVSDAEFELAKFKIQEQIDAYDKQIEKLNEVIDQTEKYYDTQIDGLNKYKEEWQKALDMEELAINMRNFIDMFGEGSIGRLLNEDMSLISQWKQSYLDTMKEIDLTSNGTFGDITKQYADLAGIDLSRTAEQTKSVAEQFDILDEAVKNVNASIGTVDGENTGSEGTDSKGLNTEDSNTLTGALQTSAIVAEESITPQIELMNGYTSAIQGAIEKINELISSIDKLNAKSINLGVGGLSSVNHAEGTVGNAFANGTGKYNGLAHNEKNALRSEYGQPELTVYPNGQHELTTEPTMSDLPKGTVIFNEKQTRKILSNKGKAIGNAFANGTILRPLQQGDRGYELVKTAEQLKDKIISNMIPSIDSINKNVELFAKTVSNVRNNNQQINNTIENVNVTCPGITSNDVARQIGNALRKEFSGMSSNANQIMSVTR